jgi:Mn-containing catalase
MPVPNLSNAAFPEAREFMKHGLHRELYTFSPDAYMEAGVIWNGKHPEDGSELEVIQGAKTGVPYPVLEEEPQLNSPGEDNFDPTMFADIAKKLGLDKDLKMYQG